MDQQLFHIFRNTPLGRETLLQSLYFCQRLNISPVVYIPEHTKFLMYFDNDVIQIDLDASYLTAPETAREHATALITDAGLSPRFMVPKHFTASTLPDIKTDFDFMCCPRSISDMSSKIGLGYIGPRVRRIVQSARFPVLMTSPVFKPWQSIEVFFGGSQNAIRALRLALGISRVTGMPLDMYTQVEKGTEADYRRSIDEAGLSDEVSQGVRSWRFMTSGKFEENLYDIPHDALIVLGAFGHGVIRDIMFGSKMEVIQSTISNNMLIVGPQYRAVL